MLSALRHSFRYCDLRVMRASYYMATCSNEPLSVRPFSGLPVPPRLKEELLRSIPWVGLDEFFEDTRVSPDLFARHTPVVPRENTDDHPVLEFLVVRGTQLGKLGSDPFVAHQRQWNIDPVRSGEGASPSRMVRRAGVFSRVSHGFFEQNFLPLIREDRALTAPFLVWRAEQNAADGDREQARRDLHQALEIDPGLEAASRALERLGER